MTTISPHSKVVTLINVFTVEPANQRQLLELLARATETSVRHAPDARESGAAALSTAGARNRKVRSGNV